MAPNDINTFADKLKVLLRHASLRERFETAIDHRDFSEFTASTMVKSRNGCTEAWCRPPRKTAEKDVFQTPQTLQKFHQGER